MPSTSPHSSRKPSTARSSEWTLVVDGDRARLSRSWRAMLAPYVVLLALTIAYYPLAAWVLAHRAMPSSSLVLAVVVSVPILAMASWVPRLAGERRRIAMAIDPVQLTVQRTRLDRARLLQVVLLPQRTLTGTRHRVFITYAIGDFANMISLVSERDVEAARGIAVPLAQWVGIPLSAATSAPPTAKLVS